jgi:hypothetical protein
VNEIVPLFTSSIGLLIILLYIPGGFTQIGYWCRSGILNWLEQRLPEATTKTRTVPPVSLTRTTTSTPESANADGSVLSTTDLTVRFGGIVAVDSVDFHAAAGEVIGLIGTNGAGKSTLLNAVGGFVPSQGRVELLGKNISRLPAHRRSHPGQPSFGAWRPRSTRTRRRVDRASTASLALEAPTDFWRSIRNERRSGGSRRAIDFSASTRPFTRRATAPAGDA